MCVCIAEETWAILGGTYAVTLFAAPPPLRSGCTYPHSRPFSCANCIQSSTKANAAILSHLEDTASTVTRATPPNNTRTNIPQPALTQTVPNRVEAKPHLPRHVQHGHRRFLPLCRKKGVEGRDRGLRSASTPLPPDQGRGGALYHQSTVTESSAPCKCGTARYRNLYRERPLPSEDGARSSWRFSNKAKPRYSNCVARNGPGSREIRHKHIYLG